MSEDWASAAADVAEGLAEAGSDAFLVETSTTGGDTFDPGSGTTSESETAVKAAIVDYSAREREAGSIQAGDRRALVSAPSGVSVPTIKTRLRFKPASGTVDYQIADVNVIQPAGPGGVAVMFDMQVRAA